MKRYIFSIILFLIFGVVFAQDYKISNVTYNIEGITKIDYLNNEIYIDNQKIFNTKDEIESYILFIKQDLLNLRKFDSVEILTTESIDSNTELIHLDLVINIKEKSHFILAPYASVLTPLTGLEIVPKLKFQDNNFLGRLNIFEAELKFTFSNNFKTYEPAFLLNYDLPFVFGDFKISWINNHYLAYKFGQNGNNSPNFDLETGIALEKKINNIITVNGKFVQKLIKDFNFTKYGDEAYAQEFAEISVPINLFKIQNHYYVTDEPYANYIYNWDYIDRNIYIINEKLVGPKLTFGNKIYFNNVNWNNNFRKGVSFVIDTSYSYNYALAQLSYGKAVSYGINANLKTFYSFERVSLQTNILLYLYNNSTIKFDNLLRGVRDNQTYMVSSDYICESDRLILINFDLPIKLFLFDWSSFGLNKMTKFNFEVQVSPFIDIALTHNKITESNFNFCDGFYAAGLEFLVYPTNWPGLTVRANLGFDLGRTLLQSKINTFWRDSRIPNWEFYLGFDLHY